jgi:hypothetical protein
MLMKILLDDGLLEYYSFAFFLPPSSAFRLPPFLNELQENFLREDIYAANS